MTAKGFFVTATDTGVGKTVVSGALIRALMKEGRDVCGMKPIETGCVREGDRLLPGDGSFLRDVSGGNEILDDITPYRFEPPLAPMVAAEMEMRELEPQWLIRDVERLAHRHDTLVVEGIGGLLVPITRDYSVLDLARDLAFPLIVVASPALGTINHTLLTVNYAIKEGLAVAGVIINYARPPELTLAEETNPGVIKDLCPAPLLGVMPFLPDITIDTLETARGKLDMVRLERYLR